jgi:serine phosphatase RsbU (regulator of sigma subunit)
MDAVNERIAEALKHEEEKAEWFANGVRIVLLLILTLIAVLNIRSITTNASLLNLCALLIGYWYGAAVFVIIRRVGYRPLMKYITSCFDIILVFTLLVLYTAIDVPSVALKNYVFLIVFPLIGLTVFRFDLRLTVVSGVLSIALYLGLTIYLHLSASVTFTHGGYESELFTKEVTYVGQLTKILILCGYVLLMSYLAEYTRTLFVKIVSNESNLLVRQELINRDLVVASDVQNLLQSHQFPDIAGLDICGLVEQGKFVGGDYCDFLKIDNDEILMVVADVSGKGVPAALIMSEVRTTIHIIVSEKLDLERLVGQLNALLVRSTRKKDFVTFFAARINASSHIVRYVNAGHPPPLIFSGGVFRSLDQRTIPLGLLPVLPDLTIVSEQFAPGDIFICYTDGLFERMNPDSEQFGEDRVRKYILANSIRNAGEFTHHFMNEVKEFGHGRELDDDVTIAVVKHTAAV